MNKLYLAIGALFVLIVFQQAEIQTVHSDVQDIASDVREIKELVVRSTNVSHGIVWTAADKECLAKNIFHEAGTESRAGKFAVAQVTFNRLKTGKWGRTLCDVVYAKAQFSWTLVPKRKTEVPKGPLWEESKHIADAMLTKGYHMPALMKAQYYHAEWIAPPSWTKSVVKNTQIGQHIFYNKI